MKNQPCSQKRGSALLGVLIVVLVLAAAIGGYVQLTFSEFRGAQRNLLYQSSLNLAEAGAEEAFRMINGGDFSVWPSQTVAGGGTMRANRMIENFRNGEVHVITVAAFFDASGDPERLVAEGRIIQGNIDVSRQVEIDITSFRTSAEVPGRRLFLDGWVAEDEIALNGHVTIDSYDSDLGPYLEALFNGDVNRSAEAGVGSLSIFTDAISGGQTTVFGYLMVGNAEGAFRHGPHFQLRGLESQPDNIDHERVTADFYAVLEPVPHPVVSTYLPYLGEPALGEAGTSTVYRADNITDSLIIHGDVTLVVDKNISISGIDSLTVTEGSSLTVFVKGDMSVGGNGIVNQHASDLSLVGRPAQVVIYGTGGASDNQSISLGGNAIMSAAVYAPVADVSLNGGGSSGDFFGAAVGKTITVNGNNYGLHYDLALRSFESEVDFGDNTGGLAVEVDGWRELHAGQRYSTGEWFTSDGPSGGGDPSSSGDSGGLLDSVLGSL